MISQKSEFEFIDRGFKDTMVLLYGWATDQRIFSALDLDYNYLFPTKLNPFEFENELLNVLEKKSINKVCLFGWSLGSFLAAEFAKNNPGLIEQLILLSIRNKFDRGALKDIETKIKKNKKAYLHKFYLECFSGKDQNELVWFKRNLLKNYTEEMELEGLISGLGYLSGAQLDIKPLSGLEKIKIFHGVDDRIAPFKEAQEIGKRFQATKFISLQNCGHIPFLKHNFRGIFYRE